MSDYTSHAGSTRKRARTAFVAAAVGALLVSTFGFAEWLSSGIGEGRAQAGHAQTLTATPAQPTTQLYPGGQADVALVVSNPNPFAVAIRRIVGNGTITSDVADCDAPSSVSFTDQTNLSLSVAGNASLDVSLPDAASMSANASDGCQGATFTIPVAINAETGPSPTPVPTPVSDDVDGDGLTDQAELAFGSDPNSPDTDGDGMPDGQERSIGTDMCLNDTDADGLQDPVEVNANLAPTDRDMDNDGIEDGLEFTTAGGGGDGDLMVANADVDGDGLQDGTELTDTEPVPALVVGTDFTGGCATQGTIYPGTDTSAYVPDADPSTTTIASDPDTDHDGVIDGAEDANHNGRVDAGETDPNDPGSF